MHLTPNSLMRVFGIYPSRAQKLLSTLSPHERLVVAYVAKGWTPRGIARKFGWKQERAKRAMYRATKKLGLHQGERLGVYGLPRVWYCAMLGEQLDRVSTEEEERRRAVLGEIAALIAVHVAKEPRWCISMWKGR